MLQPHGGSRRQAVCDDDGRPGNDLLCILPAGAAVQRDGAEAHQALLSQHQAVHVAEPADAGLPKNRGHPGDSFHFLFLSLGSARVSSYIPNLNFKKLYAGCSLSLSAAVSHLQAHLQQLGSWQT